MKWGGGERKLSYMQGRGGLEGQPSFLKSSQDMLLALRWKRDIWNSASEFIHHHEKLEKLHLFVWEGEQESSGTLGKLINSSFRVSSWDFIAAKSQSTGGAFKGRAVESWFAVACLHATNLVFLVTPCPLSSTRETPNTQDDRSGG